MKRKISLLCALLLAIVSIGAFVFVFPAGQSTMPEKQSAQDTAQTQPPSSRNRPSRRPNRPPSPWTTPRRWARIRWMAS